MLKRIILVVVFLVAIAITYHGIRLGDPAEVEINANLICLSCMGLEG
jgi:hypothetical protein